MNCREFFLVGAVGRALECFGITTSEAIFGLCRTSAAEDDEGVEEDAVEEVFVDEVVDVAAVIGMGVTVVFCEEVLALIFGGTVDVVDEVVEAVVWGALTWRGQDDDEAVVDA